MSKFTYKSVANVLAYAAVVLVGVSLLLNKLFDGNQIASIFKHVADILAYTMLAISSISYATSRRNAVFVIVWIIAVVMIVVSYVL
jgi:uncharacterized membrane protein